MLADIIPKIAAEEQPPMHAYFPRPSLAGPDRCIRQMTYHAKGTPAAPWPGRALLIFDDSSWHEELTKDWIRKTAFRLHSEQMAVDCPLPGPLRQRVTCEVCERPVAPNRLHGHIDGIFTDMLQVDRVFEHKGINHFSFEAIWKGNWPLDNIAQTCIYTRGVQEDNPEITEALLLLKNKNTAAYMELLLRYDRDLDSVAILEILRSDGQRSKPGVVIPDVIASIFHKFRLVEEHISEDTLPVRPFPVGTEFPCGYCRWGRTCWEGYETEFAQMATEQALTQEIEGQCAYYLETSGHAKQMTNEKDGLRDGILAYMIERDIRTGRAGPYVVSRELRSRSKYVDDLIPPEILGVAKQKKMYEVLTIRKPTKGKPPASTEEREE